MKQRDIFKMLALMFVTFGIYNLYWLKQTRDEMVARGAKIPTFWLLFAPLVFFILLTIGLFVALVTSSSSISYSSFIPFMNDKHLVAQASPDSEADATNVTSDPTTEGDSEPLSSDSSGSSDLNFSTTSSDQSSFEDSNDEGGNLLVSAFVILCIIGTVLSIVLNIYWYYKYCHGIEVVTHGQTTYAYSFMLLIVLEICAVGFVWPLIMQDSFNKHTGSGPANDHDGHGDPSHHNQQQEPPYPTASSTPPQSPTV